MVINVVIGVVFIVAVLVVIMMPFDDGKTPPMHETERRYEELMKRKARGEDVSRELWVEFKINDNEGGGDQDW